MNATQPKPAAPKPEPLRCKACGCGFNDITPLCQGRAVLHAWVPASQYLRHFAAGLFGDAFAKAMGL